MIKDGYLILMEGLLINNLFNNLFNNFFYLFLKKINE